MSDTKLTDTKLTLALAERVCGTRLAELPEDAVAFARHCLLDYLGVAIAGAGEPAAVLLRDDAEAAGGHPRASVIAGRRRLTVDQAALVNGAAGHAHDYDDVHTAMNGHPTVPVAPAVLALAEHLGASGSEALAAFAAGVDTECILGRYAGGSHYAAGFHATATLGAFGAAAAAARLMGLDAETTARALGIAGTRAAGLKAQFGTMTKPLHAGLAAQTGTAAARWAAAGYTSRTDILEAPQGFMATQCASADPARFLTALETPSYLPGVCFKYHAACYLTHAAIEATRTLVARNALTGAGIDSVTVEVDPGHLGVCNIAEPATGLEAKFSLRFVVAMTISGEDTAAIATYTDALTRRSDLVALRDKVTVTPYDAPSADTRVTIRAGGEALGGTLNVAIPMTDLDAQWHKVTGKFRALATPVLGAEHAQALIDACAVLESQADLTPFFKLIRGET